MRAISPADALTTTRVSARRLLLCAVLVAAMLPAAPIYAEPSVTVAAYVPDATPLVLASPSGTRDDSLSQAAAHDYYTIALAAGDLFHVEALGDPADSDSLDMALYAGESNSPFDLIVESDTPDSGDESITWLVPPSADGTYTIEVKMPYVQPDVSYSLTWETSVPDVARLWGKDRYETSYAISRSTFATATTAVIASGADFPDALAASGLAGVFECPILLTKPGSVPPGLRREIQRLGVSKLYIVGGDAAVNGDVYTELNGLVSEVPERLSGQDRYETAVEVAKEIRAESSVPTDTVFIVRGSDFADALAVSPFAYAQKMPVLLTRTSVLSGDPDSFLDNFNYEHAVIAGGESAVGPEVFKRLEAIVGPGDVDRWYGSNRYATAVDVATEGISAGWLPGWSRVGLATGASFPDALGGGVSCGAFGAPLLLSKGTSLSSQPSTAIDGMGVSRALLFGGEAALSQEVEADVLALLP